MGIPLISLIPKVFKAAAGILGIDSVKDVVDAINNNKLTPEQRVELEQAVQEHTKEMRQLDITELKEVMSETSLMIQSTDKYVARARPTGLYTAYVISLGLAAALVFGVQIDATAILTLCAPMYGAQGYYMHLRTKEKMNGGNGD